MAAADVSKLDLTAEQIKRLNHMCPGAARVSLGDLIDAAYDALVNHEARIATLEEG